MSYRQHYVVADDVMNDLATFIGTVPPQRAGHIAGFAAVTAVTVYELALKTIFESFASLRHQDFAHFVGVSYERMNARVALDFLRKEHLPRFGDRYLVRFKRLLDAAERNNLRRNGASVKASYSNLVVWRNDFAHQGRVAVNATFAEVHRSYHAGKVVIECVARALSVNT